RAAGVPLVVDAAQSAGMLKTDVETEMIDVLVASTQKGLLALYGMGFMYVRKALAEDFRPTYLSRLGVELDSEHEAASGGFESFRYAAGARRFDVGNFNYLGAVAAERAIRNLLALGPDAVEAHLLGLARRMRDGLAQLGAPVFRGEAPGEEAHIVAIGESLADSHDRTDSQDMVRLNAYLTANGVRHSIRRGVLRLSLHAYNDAGDVDRVLELVGEFYGRK
ncbi:MAG: aminotransferase class V-fold PLP-dependent enzyme, partial [Alphaproteobacteria bacterium]